MFSRFVQEEEDIQTVSWMRNEMYDSIGDIPSFSSFQDGKLMMNMWTKNGVLYRENFLPSIIEYYPNGNIFYKEWSEYKQDFPYYIEYRKNESVKLKIYSIGKNQSLEVQYRRNGKIFCETYKVNSKIHRENLPAKIYYDKYGFTTCVEWWSNGLLHRENKPAKIFVNNAVSVTKIEWWLNGVNKQISPCLPIKIDECFEYYINQYSDVVRIQTNEIQSYLYDSSNFEIFKVE